MTNKKVNKHVFQVIAPAAKKVLLVGDRSHFPMQRDANGIWTANVALAPGRHRYSFVVDGEWQDARAWRLHSLNPFGSEDALREVA